MSVRKINEATPVILCADILCANSAAQVASG